MYTKSTDREFDFFPTDPKWVEVLLQNLDSPITGSINEPAVGDGSIARVLKDHGHTVIASDVQDYGYPGTLVKDAYDIPKADNVITNPPYLYADGMIQHWLRSTKGIVAVCMRVGYLEGTKRYELYRSHRPHQAIIVCNRMTVHGKASQFPHVWLVWDNRKQPQDWTKLTWAKVKNSGNRSRISEQVVGA
jgi:hypothetical protein